MVVANRGVIDPRSGQKALDPFYAEPGYPSFQQVKARRVQSQMEYFSTSTCLAEWYDFLRPFQPVVDSYTLANLTPSSEIDFVYV